MNGIERPLYVAQKFLRNNCTNVSFMSLLITSLLATVALIANEAQAQTTTSTVASPTTTAEIATTSELSATSTEAVPTPEAEPVITADSSGPSLREANRATQQVALTARQQERIINLAANTSNRIESVIARLEQITNRLQTRITKLADSGVDVAEATRLSLLASDDLQAARDALATIDTDVTAAITSASPAIAWREVRGTYVNAADLTRSAHQNLVAAVRALTTPAATTATLDTPAEATATNE